MYKERRRRSRRATAGTSVGDSGRWNGGEGSFLNGEVVLEVGEEDGGPKNVFLRVVVVKGRVVFVCCWSPLFLRH